MIGIQVLPLLKPCAGRVCQNMKCLCKVPMERLLKLVTPTGQTYSTCAISTELVQLQYGWRGGGGYAVLSFDAFSGINCSMYCSFVERL